MNLQRSLILPVWNISSVYEFSIERRTTEAFGKGRDVDSRSVCRLDARPRDFIVPSKVVTCLRPLDDNVDPTFIIGLGKVEGSTATDFILVWFLEKQKLGLVYDYTKPLENEEEMAEEDVILAWEARNDKLKGEFVGCGLPFSMATLEGDYRFEDGKDPEQELSIQLDQGTTFSLEPFAYEGFSVEDACRHQGVMRPVSDDPPI